MPKDPVRRHLSDDEDDDQASRPVFVPTRRPSKGLIQQSSPDSSPVNSKKLFAFDAIESKDPMSLQSSGPDTWWVEDGYDRKPAAWPVSDARRRVRNRGPIDVDEVDELSSDEEDTTIIESQEAKTQHSKPLPTPRDRRRLGPIDVDEVDELSSSEDESKAYQEADEGKSLEKEAVDFMYAPGRAQSLLILGGSTMEGMDTSNEGTKTFARAAAMAGLPIPETGHFFDDCTYESGYTGKDDDNSLYSTAAKRAAQFPGAVAMRGELYVPGQSFATTLDGTAVLEREQPEEENSPESTEASISLTRAIPVDAELVEEQEERMRQQILNEAPTAHVVKEGSVDEAFLGLESVENSSSYQDKDSSWRQKCILAPRAFVCLLFAVLALAIGLGVGLGIPDDPDSKPTLAPTAPDVKPDDCFTSNSDGSFVCYKEDVPASPMITLFFDCPSMDVENVFDCQNCAIIVAESVLNFNEDTPTCNGCMLCGTSRSVAYDCTNLAPEEECSFRDCSGTCGKDNPPVSSSETQADECFMDSEDGSFFCNKQGLPTSAFITQFQDCPDTLGRNVFDCEKCIVAQDDSLDDIDQEHVLCSSCLICGESIAFDCSNIAPNETCAITTCDGSCVG